MTNWETCPAVESVPGRCSGAWVFTGTRVPILTLFDNLAAGANIKDLIEWSPGVEEWQVKAVLEHEAENLRAQTRRVNPA